MAYVRKNVFCIRVDFNVLGRCQNDEVLTCECFIIQGNDELKSFDDMNKAFCTAVPAVQKAYHHFNILMIRFEFGGLKEV